MHGARGLRVKRERELFFPIKCIPRIAERVVAVASARTVARDIRGVGGDLVGDDPVLHILFVG